jgi:hypothetical protein
LELDEGTELGYEMKCLRAELDGQKSELSSHLENFRSAYRDLSIFGKIAILVILMLVSPLVLIIFILVALRSGLKIVRNTHRRFNRSLGYFLPVLFEGRPEVVVNTSKRPLKGNSDATDGVISHEHVHLLQHAIWSKGSVIRTNAAFDGARDHLLKRIVDPKLSANSYRFIKYIALLNEAEARLHEVTLSFYREYRELPTDYAQFITMLRGAEELGTTVGLFLAATGDRDPKDNPMPYQVRFVQAAEEISSLILFLADKEISSRFITEVLPVMYGNLLRLYGANSDADRFLQTIPCTQLFDELYRGPEAATATS